MATTIKNLSSDLIVSIFLRLPVKSLFQCRCVCISFQEIIKSHEFIHLHLKQTHHNHHNQDHIFIFHYPHKEGPDPDSEPYIITRNTKNHFSFHDQTFSTSFYTEPPFVDTRNNLILPIGSCKGVVCLAGYDRVYFWNPAMRICKTIDVFFRESPDPDYLIIFGFGFVSQINDFKLVRLKQDRLGKSKLEVDVYTLGLSSWRRVQHNVSGATAFYPTTFVNGVVYWHTKKRPKGNSQVYTFILGFDLDKEVFHEITLPDNFSDIRIYEYNESLCFNTLSVGNVCEIWVKEDYNSADSWLKLYSFRLQGFPKEIPEFWLLNNDELLFAKNSGNLVLCDPTDGRVKRDLPPLKHVCLPRIDRYHIRVLNYTESLLLLDQAEVISNESNVRSGKKRTWFEISRRTMKTVSLMFTCLIMLSCLVPFLSLWLMPPNS